MEGESEVYTDPAAETADMQLRMEASSDEELELLLTLRSRLLLLWLNVYVGRRPSHKDENVHNGNSGVEIREITFESAREFFSKSLFLSKLLQEMEILVDAQSQDMNMPDEKSPRPSSSNGSRRENNFEFGSVAGKEEDFSNFLGLIEILNCFGVSFPTPDFIHVQNGDLRFANRLLWMIFKNLDLVRVSLNNLTGLSALDEWFRHEQDVIVAGHGEWESTQNEREILDYHLADLVRMLYRQDTLLHDEVELFMKLMKDIGVNASFLIVSDLLNDIDLLFKDFKCRTLLAFLVYIHKMKPRTPWSWCKRESELKIFVEKPFKTRNEKVRRGTGIINVNKISRGWLWCKMVNERELLLPNYCVSALQKGSDREIIPISRYNGKEIPRGGQAMFHNVKTTEYDLELRKGDLVAVFAIDPLRGMFYGLNSRSYLMGIFPQRVIRIFGLKSTHESLEDANSDIEEALLEQRESSSKFDHRTSISIPDMNYFSSNVSEADDSVVDVALANSEMSEKVLENLEESSLGGESDMKKSAFSTDLSSIASDLGDRRMTTVIETEEAPSKVKIVKEGWLKKRGAKRKNWLKRWIRLTTVDLSYAKTADQEPIRTILLSSIQYVRNNDVGSGSKYPFLSIGTEGRVYYIRKSHKETSLDEWRRKISLAISLLDVQSFVVHENSMAQNTQIVGETSIMGSPGQASLITPDSTESNVYEAAEPFSYPESESVGSMKEFSISIGSYADLLPAVRVSIKESPINSLDLYEEEAIHEIVRSLEGELLTSDKIEILYNSFPKKIMPLTCGQLSLILGVSSNDIHERYSLLVVLWGNILDPSCIESVVRRHVKECHWEHLRRILIKIYGKTIEFT